MIAVRAVRLLAATLPDAVRERYREEWSADVAAARNEGIAPASIVAGALGVAIRIDRESPATTGMTPGRLAARRMRVVLASTTTTLLLLFANFWLWSATGIETRGNWGAATGQGLLLAAAALSGIVALVALVGVVRALIRSARSTASRRAVLVLSLVGIPLLLLVLAATAVIPLVGAVLALPVLIAPIIVVAVLDPRTQPAPLGRASAVGVTALGAAAILAIIAGGLLHVYVWNPLARMPGMTLDEIYAGLAAAGEVPSPILTIVWAGFWALIALAMVVLALTLPRRLLTARRLVGASLLGVALTASGVWFAGFGMGMGMADAFMTSGGDAAASGLVFTMIGIGCGIAAALLGLLPSRAPAATSLAE